MLIGLAVKEFRNNDLDFNLNQIIKTAEEYKTSKLDFLCFGEAFLQGFDAFKWNNDDFKVAVSKDSSFIELLKSVARNNNIGLAFGYLEEYQSKLYSSYLIIDDNGEEILNYRRFSRGWKESYANENIYQEGKVVGHFKYKGKNIVVGVCGDFWNDEYIEKTAKLEKDIILWPAYVNYSLDDWHKEITDYALQTTKFGEKVLMVNSISHNPNSYGGCFDFYQGKIKAKLEFGQKDVLIIDID